MHQVDDDTTRAPFLLSGGCAAWTERTPVLFGTRRHFVPKSVEGRPIKAPQRSKRRPAKVQEAYWVSRDVTIR